MTSENPWMWVHTEVETELTGDRATAARVVANEYDGAPEPVPCGCGGTAWYKATIGAMKCPECGELYHTNGRAVRR